jgi:hypothetical protein
LEAKPRRFERMPADAALVKALIARQVDAGVAR